MMHIHERAASPKNMPLPWQSLRGRHTFFAQQQRSQSFAECSHSTTGDHRAAAFVVPADGGDWRRIHRIRRIAPPEHYPMIGGVANIL